MAVKLKEALVAEAHRLGFERVGVTTPDPPPHFPVFQDWVEAGRHGDMAYLASDRSLQRRSDPRQILPECRSILVLALPYDPPPTTPPPANPPRYTGQVAAYAWGADYHDVLPEKLSALVAFLESLAGHPIPNRWYTDTGPILERDLAQQAGLGWIGKNTCLIHPRQGSYFLLAEILLGLELEPDLPFLTDHCGSCTRCLEACPTACILPDRTLDAHRCISYLTIELKGPIPVELRPQVGQWAFGCDLCQQVCPWNLRFAVQPVDPALPPRPEVPRPDLVRDLHELTPESFNRRFKGSPIRRTKRRGYLRNVAVALGNAAAGSQDPQAVQALSHALLDEPEPLVRSHAAWALARVGGEAAHQALLAALANESDASVLAEIQLALDGA